jgi:tryptophan halogenase
MKAPDIRRIVIVGGGTAGWMAAAPLALLLGPATEQPREVVLVESPDIGTVGVGEATLPPIRHYNRRLGIAGDDFMRRTQATFKLGIEFKDWRSLGHRFFHGFGDFGPPILNRSAFQYWLRLRAQGPMPPLEDWSTASVMARHHRFTPPQGEQPSAANAYSFAYHFDAGLYAAYLRDHALANGVQRLEGTIVDVVLRPEDGFVQAVTLADGRRVEGDLFIDCTGFRGLLIEGAMQAGYEDWSHHLPVNRALAVPSANAPRLTPYTTSTARTAGWQWRIPLQHRIGNGHVFCDGFTTQAEAETTLLQGLDTEPLGQPRSLAFTTGKRRRQWVKNVVAVGLSSGFLEPLESTSIQLIMDAVGRLIELFPQCDCAPQLAAEFNRRMDQQYESVRDFIILHYKLSQRDDTDFWRHVRAMPIPDRLAHQIELFRHSARVAVIDPDSFAEPSWVSLMLGLGLEPEALDPLTAQVPLPALQQHFSRLRQAIQGTVNTMPDHADYLARHVRG